MPGVNRNREHKILHEAVKAGLAPEIVHLSVEPDLLGDLLGGLADRLEKLDAVAQKR